MSMSKKVIAISFLGFSFFKLLLKKIFLFRRRGQKQFLQSYEVDHIFPVSLQIRQEMSRYSACYTCRICDVACPQVGISGFSGPAFLVASFSRSLVDYHLYNSDLHYCENCSSCEKSCPQKIPIKNIISFMGDVAKSKSSIQ